MHILDKKLSPKLKSRSLLVVVMIFHPQNLIINLKIRIRRNHFMTEKTHKNQKKVFQDPLLFISKKNSQIIYKNCIILTKRKANNNLK